MSHALLALFSVWLIGQAQGVPRLVPIDEASANTSFREFREQLLQAVRERNLKRVLAMTAADVHVSHGRTGLAALRREWQLDRSPEAMLYELETIIGLGGRFSQSSCTFVAPYVWTEFPESLHDVDYVVVLRANTRILTQPGSGDAVGSVTTGDLLKYDLGQGTWFHVTTADGKVGYVNEANVRKPNSYRVYFTRIMEEWRIVGFLRGVD
jgi:hypothetical protein